jgi:hypothetical protein
LTRRREIEEARESTCPLRERRDQQTELKKMILLFIFKQQFRNSEKMKSKENREKQEETAKKMEHLSTKTLWAQNPLRVRSRPVT